MTLAYTVAKSSTRHVRVLCFDVVMRCKLRTAALVITAQDVEVLV